jgi:Mg2+-importing ATPase
MLGKTLLPEIKKPVAPGNRPPPPSSKLDEAAYKSADEVLEMLGTSAAGLNEDEAAARLEEYGPNQVAHEEKEGWLHRLYVSARNPLVILLTVLAFCPTQREISPPVQS